MTSYHCDLTIPRVDFTFVRCYMHFLCQSKCYCGRLIFKQNLLHLLMSNFSENQNFQNGLLTQCVSPFVFFFVVGRLLPKDGTWCKKKLLSNTRCSSILPPANPISISPPTSFLSHHEPMIFLKTRLDPFSGMKKSASIRSLGFIRQRSNIARVKKPKLQKENRK